jgi:UDP-N-acetylmuramoyl-tripeptide--D-alanyl-D-alanine ligase
MIKLDDFLSLKGSKIYNRVCFRRTNITGVGIDSRTIKKSEAFFAIKGESTDGHKFLKQVVNKGVSLVVICSRNRAQFKQTLSKTPYVTVPDTISALGELAHAHRKKFKTPFLAIGGSNGKTTTKDLVSSVLLSKYRVLKTEGNFNNHIGLPLTILRMNSKHEFAVLEVGSNHFGEIEYLNKIAEPNFGMVTNIGKEHLEFFKNEKGVAKAEFELYDYLRKEDEGVCFMNMDDKYIREYARKLPSKKKFTYSYGYKTDVTGKFVKFNKDFEPVIRVKGMGKEFEVRIATFGKHSIYNGLAAAAAGMYFKVPVAKIKKALGNFKPASSKRMEVTKHKGMIFINDAYNSNPNSVVMGLETLNEYKAAGNKYILLSDMLELGKTSKKEHSDIGKLVKKMGFQNLYTYGKDSFNTFKSAKGVENNFYFESKDDMAGMLKAVLGKGDVVYIKGSRGMKMEEVLNSLIN